MAALGVVARGREAVGPAEEVGAGVAVPGEEGDEWVAYSVEERPMAAPVYAVELFIAIVHNGSPCVGEISGVCCLKVRLTWQGSLFAEQDTCPRKNLRAPSHDFESKPLPNCCACCRAMSETPLPQ